MNYFKSHYQLGIFYSPNWYGILDYAPNAIILLYDDNQGYCIGYMENELPLNVIPMSETEAQNELDNAQDIEGVFFGDKLLHRWEVNLDG